MDNEEKLKINKYPGRGIIIGKSPDSRNLIQVYWIMGRSQNSRNRVFEEEGGFVRTRAYDEKKVEDPSLIIYYPIKYYNNYHVVTNGDQTDTIIDFLKKGKSFEEAIETRTFEPDEPNYTPRISGIINADPKGWEYKLSIIKSKENNPQKCIRQFFTFEKGIPGIGHCIHTYKKDGNPLPPFEGEPYTVKLFDYIEKTASYYWNILNEDNKISLLVKFIDINTKKSQIKIINKNK